MFFFFFFNDTATTEIYTLSLHDALPICSVDPNFGRRVRNRRQLNSLQNTWPYGYSMPIAVRKLFNRRRLRSEERFSRNAETDIVCRLLLEKKKQKETIAQHTLKPHRSHS